MIHFESDYTEGAFAHVLELMKKTNMEQNDGYGEDVHSENARNLIRRACESPQAAVYFLVGGTQTNKTVIQSVLKPFQGVISADTGHINVHEAGIIEAGGHKVLTVPATDGKITAKQIWDYAKDLSKDYHVVQAGMVYISNPTETGTMYTKRELQDIRTVCDKLNLPLFIDGARMSYGLYAPGNDLYLPDYANLCDVFTIGGTKCGALFGEAVVITNDSMKSDFPRNIKQNGALLAKGWLLGLQFEALFDENNLYYKGGEHGAKLGVKLHNALSKMGFEFQYPSLTNQQFVAMPNNMVEKLKDKYVFMENGIKDENTTYMRICTNWATLENDLEDLIVDLKKAIK
jgi:threonine aldolase